MVLLLAENWTIVNVNLKAFGMAMVLLSVENRTALKVNLKVSGLGVAGQFVVLLQDRKMTRLDLRIQAIALKPHLARVQQAVHLPQSMRR